MISLYQHQTDLLNNLRTAIHTHRRIIAVASTGFGKTRLSCAIIESALAKGNTIIILVNRDKLVKQWAEVLTGFGIDHGIIQYGIEPNTAPVQLASVDSYVTRLDKTFDICISDECHYALGDNYRACIEHQHGISIGLTATPTKMSGQGFSSLYDKIVHGVDMMWLILNGYLSPLEIYSPNPPDLDLELIDGEFNQSQYMRKVSGTSRLSNAVEMYKKHIPDKLTIVFAVNIQDAKNIAEQFNLNGIPAKCIHSKQKQVTQDLILSEFRNKKYLVLVSVNILSEGFDCPWIEAGIDLSPTASLARFIQRWGRCVRSHPCKTHATMLDLAGNYWIHGAPWVDHKWSLDGRVVSKKSLEENIASACICMSCGRNYSSTQESCPYCGAGKQHRKRAIKTAEGTLTLVTENEAIKAEQAAEEAMRAKEQAERDRIARNELLKIRKKAAKTLDDYVQIEKELHLKYGWGYINYNIYRKYIDKYR